MFFIVFSSILAGFQDSLGRIFLEVGALKTPKGHVKWQVQNHMADLGIQDYSINQPSLEQVFVRFAREQEEQEEPEEARKWTNMDQKPSKS